MSKLQAVPPRRLSNHVFSIVNPMHQLQLYSGASQAGRCLGVKAQHGEYFVFAPEDERTVLSQMKSEAHASPFLYPNGLPGSSFELGFRTAPSSFDGTWSNYPNGPYGRSFDSGVETAPSSFASGWHDADLAFAGAEYSFGAPQLSPQLVGFPAAQSPPVLAGPELTTWAPQPCTHVAPSDTHVDWAASIDIRLQMRSDNFDKTLESPDISMGVYDSFDEGLVDASRDVGAITTQVQKDSDTESDEKRKKRSRRSSTKSRSKNGGTPMRSEGSLIKRKRPAQRQSKTVYDVAGRPVRASVVGSTGAHRCYFEDPETGKICQRSFRRSEHLKRHRNTTHSGEKPFHCPIPNCQDKTGKRSKGSGSEGPKGFNRSDNVHPHIVRHIQKPAGAPRTEPSMSFEEVCRIIRGELGTDAVQKLEREKAYGKICAAAQIKCNGLLCDGKHCEKLAQNEKPTPCDQGDDCSVTKRIILDLELKRLKNSRAHEATHPYCV